MQIFSQSRWKSQKTHNDPQWRKELQLYTMQQVIQSNCSSEQAPTHPHWREEAQVHTMQLYNKSNCSSPKPHYEAYWGKASNVQCMQVFLHYSESPSKTYEEKTCRKVAIHSNRCSRSQTEQRNLKSRNTILITDYFQYQPILWMGKSYRLVCFNIRNGNLALNGGNK